MGITKPTAYLTRLEATRIPALSASEDIRRAVLCGGRKTRGGHRRTSWDFTREALQPTGVPPKWGRLQTGCAAMISRISRGSDHRVAHQVGDRRRPGEGSAVSARKFGGFPCKKRSSTK